MKKTALVLLGLVLVLGFIGCDSAVDNPPVEVSDISVTGTGDATIINSDEGTLQMSATVSPDDATDPSVTWSVETGTGTAAISSAGLLTAVTDGTVTVKATSVSTPAVSDELEITISNQTHVAWAKRNFVDSFGDPTDTPYITNIGRIEGTFSNSATSDSLLEVSFIIDNSTDIALQLFEYGGDNPVKSYGRKKYELLIKDILGEVYSLTGINHSDRIILDESSSTILHNLLLGNDKLKIHIEESDYRTTKYDFEVDARGYGFAYNEYLK